MVLLAGEESKVDRVETLGWVTVEDEVIINICPGRARLSLAVKRYVDEVGVEAEAEARLISPTMECIDRIKPELEPLLMAL